MAPIDRLYPERSEYSPKLAAYFDLVLSQPSVIETLARQRNTIVQFAKLSAERFSQRYAPGKWSVKELISHLIDSERVFNYRALRFARNDLRPQDGFDEDLFVAESGADSRAPADLIEEFDALRRGTILFYNSLPDAALLRSGEANGKLISVRALACFVAGHTEHHLSVLADRYSFPG
jgi:hypothetical protein